MGLTCTTPLTTPAFQRGDVTMSLAVNFSVYQMSSPTDTLQALNSEQGREVPLPRVPSLPRPGTPLKSQASESPEQRLWLCLSYKQLLSEGPRDITAWASGWGRTRAESWRFPCASLCHGLTEIPPELGGWVNPSISGLRTLRLTNTERLR